MAQNQSMTISHAGLQPNDTLWVYPGEPIDFIFGSGGTHPMTSGQGSTPSPVFFPTVTVSTSNTLETFSLTTVGTYIFHCATNPNNTDNWGTIIVENQASVDELQTNTLTLHPNPAKQTVQFNASTSGEYIINDITGRLVQHGDVEKGNVLLDIQRLKSGQYYLLFITKDKTSTSHFIKE